MKLYLTLLGGGLLLGICLLLPQEGWTQMKARVAWEHRIARCLPRSIIEPSPPADRTLAYIWRPGCCPAGGATAAVSAMCDSEQWMPAR